MAPSYGTSYPITRGTSYAPGRALLGGLQLPTPPLGMVYLTGADGQYLLGADGAYLLGAELPDPPAGFSYLFGADNSFLTGADGAYLLGVT